MTDLIIVRHGQSEANLSRHFACRTDTPLSALGNRQAEALAKYLPARFQIDKVYASPLSRTKNTVAPTAKVLGLPIIEEAGLLEIDAGSWENVHTSILTADKASGFHVWETHVGKVVCPEGESVAELFERVVSTVHRLAKENEGKTLLLATHWTPTHALLVHAEGNGHLEMKSNFPIANASVHHLRYENGVITPVSVHITEHLEGLI